MATSSTIAKWLYISEKLTKECLTVYINHTNELGKPGSVAWIFIKVGTIFSIMPASPITSFNLGSKIYLEGV